MRQITDISELRGIQLAILDNVVDFCDARGITYYLACGSLIGAVRHKGYIPWDDDIDLYMLRDDYDRFLKEYNSSNYELCSPLHKSAKVYYYTYAKVCDTRTVLVEDELPDYEMGVNIDIFPLDYVTDDAGKRQRLFKIKKMLYRTRRCKLQDTCFLDSRFNYLCYRYFPLPVKAISAIINHSFFSHRPTQTVTNMTEANERPSQCIPVRCLNGTALVEFEGKHYKTMAGYDEYLTIYYGDYMQLPPEDQRITHHFKAYYKS